jgi:hypothetical protein
MRRLKKSLLRFVLRGSASAAEKHYARERSLLPEQRFERILICGQPDFIADAIEALSHLKHAYPYGYGLVQRYIRAIVQSHTRPGKAGGSGVVYRKSTAEGRLGVAPNRFAAALVHEAVGVRKLVGFNVWRSPRSELISLKRELRAMQLLGCDPKYFHHVWNEILKRERQIRKSETKPAVRPV